MCQPQRDICFNETSGFGVRVIFWPPFAENLDGISCATHEAFVNLEFFFIFLAKAEVGLRPGRNLPVSSVLGWSESVLSQCKTASVKVPLSCQSSKCWMKKNDSPSSASLELFLDPRQQFLLLAFCRYHLNYVASRKNQRSLRHGSQNEKIVLVILVKATTRMFCWLQLIHVSPEAISFPSHSPAEPVGVTWAKLSSSAPSLSAPSETFSVESIFEHCRGLHPANEHSQTGEPWEIAFPRTNHLTFECCEI